MSFNKYAQYPSVSGIIIVRDKQGQHGFTMYTDNIRKRVQQVDADHINGSYGNPGHPWGEARKEFALAVGHLVFEHIPMPNTDRQTLKIVAEAIDAESVSKQML